MAAGTDQRIQLRMARPEDLDCLHHIINKAYRTDACWTNESEYVRDERITRDQLLHRLSSLACNPSTDDPLFVAEVCKCDLQ
jgi:hypothetical protein